MLQIALVGAIAAVGMAGLTSGFEPATVIVAAGVLLAVGWLWNARRDLRS